MIAYLRGNLAAKSPSSIIIDVGGVGYFIQVSTKSLAELPSVDEPVQILTYLQVKEDALSLFGFAQEQEKAMFELLISIKNVGPKLALAILSFFEPLELAQLIVAQDFTAISQAQGVGKKIAQRICMELKDSFKDDSWGINSADFDGAGSGSGAGAGAGAGGAGAGGKSAGLGMAGFSKEIVEAQQALRSMGFKEVEINAALEGCSPNSSVEEAIRYALCSLGKTR